MTKSVFRCLVLGDAEFGVHIFLHTVVVTVQVVWCDVHQYGNVGTEVIHIVQLEGTQLNDVVIMLLRGYLQGQAVADVAFYGYFRRRIAADDLLRYQN